MVISFLDGSKVVEPGVMAALKRCLCRIIKTEENVSFYFAFSSDFILECEWLVRELQALYPDKRIDRVGVVDQGTESLFSRCRFDRFECTEGKPRVGIWRWMVDQSDYVCGYMHLALCPSRDRLTAWNYACKRLQGRCLNFATEEAWLRISAQIPSLVRWQREAFEGKLRGDSKAKIAQTLGVSRTTVHMYELGAQQSLERPNIPVPEPRVCAILGLAAARIPEPQREVLAETIRYLVYCCGISIFLVQGAATSQCTQLISILRTECGRFTRETEIRSLVPAGKDLPIPRVNLSTRRVDRGLNEREAMIDGADVVLCSIKNLYGSGLNYAKRKHVPIINLEELTT